MKTITIYGLRAPGGSIRYIGKTTRPLAVRLAEHIRHAKQPRGRDNHRFKWIRGLLRQGLRPEAVVLEVCPAKQWSSAEAKWIAKLKEQGENLVNGDEHGTGLITGSTPKTGVDHYAAKITEQDVIEICSKYATGQYRQSDLAKEYGISSSNVSLLVRGEAWKHIDREAIHKQGRDITPDDVVSISEKYASGEYTQFELADEYGVSHGMIHLIVTRQEWQAVERPITHAGQNGHQVKYRVKPGPEIGLRGEDGPNSVLTAEQVIEIRQLYAAGGVSQRELGERFGVAQQTISAVVQRITWTDIP